MTSALQGSLCKSPFLHANFLSVSFYLSSSSFNCSVLHTHGETGWMLLFLCGWKEDITLLFSMSSQRGSSAQAQQLAAVGEH